MDGTSEIGFGAAKAPLALGSLGSLGLRGSFLACDGIAPSGALNYLNCHSVTMTLLYFGEGLLVLLLLTMAVT